MLKTLMTEEKLRELFLEVDKSTNNFTKFSPNILTENSNKLIIFRLSLGLSLKEFSNLFGLHLDTISQHERLEKKRMNLQSATKFMNMIENELKSKNLVQKITWETVLFSFRKFKNMLKGGFISPENLVKFNSLPIERRRDSIMRGVINSIIKKKLTPLEGRVFNHLKERNIDVTPHFMVGSKEVDLVVWKSGKPSLLIEVIQESFFPLKFIGLREKVTLPIVCLVSKDRKRDVIALDKIFDAVFFEDNLNDLVGFINGKNSMKKIEIEPIQFRELSKRNIQENEILAKLTKIDTQIKSQLKFLFRFDGKMCSKTIDFALPGIFIEVKSGDHLEFQINQAAVESLLFKTVFPDFRFFVLFKSNANSIIREKILSLPLEKAGIDNVFFSDDELVNALKN